MGRDSLNWPESLKDVQAIVREHLDEKRANLQTIIVWDGETVRELAPWEYL